MIQLNNQINEQVMNIKKFISSAKEEKPFSHIIFYDFFPNVSTNPMT